MKPSSWKISQISATTWVTRCSPPCQSGRPGIVRSTPRARHRPRFSARSRASTACSSSRFSALAAPPRSCALPRRGRQGFQNLGERAGFAPQQPVLSSWSRRSSACGFPSDAPAATRGPQGGRSWIRGPSSRPPPAVKCRGIPHGEIGEDLRLISTPAFLRPFMRTVILRARANRAPR